MVDEIAKDNPLYSFVRMLAREALDASKYVRKNFSALPLNKTTTHSALPPAKKKSTATSFQRRFRSKR